ncbi:Uncharacterized protein Adt_39530 [Abeliophyllum distichum]|uniref:Uncharacterized protein n=1 Tax=Abeliophyllum distichum TaxID=126358 RepID=A0ABD1Q5B5_9LAMI
MSRMIGSSFDTLKRRKIMEKKDSKIGYSSMGLVNTPVSSNDLSSQIELSDAASLAACMRGRPGSTLGVDGSIVLSFPPESSTFSNPGVVALGEGLLFPEDQICYEELGQVKAA